MQVLTAPAHPAKKTSCFHCFLAIDEKNMFLAVTFKRSFKSQKIPCTQVKRSPKKSAEVPHTRFFTVNYWKLQQRNQNWHWNGTYLLQFPAICSKKMCMRYILPQILTENASLDCSINFLYFLGFFQYFYRFLLMIYHFWVC